MSKRKQHAPEVKAKVALEDMREEEMAAQRPAGSGCIRR